MNVLLQDVHFYFQFDDFKVAMRADLSTTTFIKNFSSSMTRKHFVLILVEGSVFKVLKVIPYSYRSIMRPKTLES